VSRKSSRGSMGSMNLKGWKHSQFYHYNFKKGFLCVLAPLRALRETRKV
jgi:hypothetical protein